MSNIWLVSYLVMWILSLVVYQRKRKGFDAGSLLLGLYTFYALMSLLLYNNADYRSYFQTIHLLPFIYLFIMLRLAMSPVFQYCQSDIKDIKQPNNNLIIIVSLFFVVPSLVHLPGSISNIQGGITRLILDASNMSEMYRDALEQSESSGTGGVSNLAAIFSSAFYDLGVLITFYYFTLNNRKKLLSIALVVSCLVGLLSSVSLGQRGAIVSRALTLAIGFLIMKPFYSERTFKVLSRSAAAIGFGVVLLLLMMTIGRFANHNTGASGSAEYYTGQANLYFNNYGLDDGGIRYGDRTVPLFKEMIGFSNVPRNFWQRRDKYPHLKINDEVFCTFVGDFTIDFGPILAFAIFIFFTALIYPVTRIRGRTVLFHQLILIHFVSCICVQGGMTLFSYSDIGGNLAIIVFFVAYFVFKFDNQSRIKKISL